MNQTKVDPFSKLVNLQSIASAQQQPSPFWDPQTLSHGFPGLILLFSALDRQNPDGGWDEVVHQNVIALKMAIEEEGIASLSLFSGLAGCCFALRRASRNGQRYQKIISTLENHLIASLQKELIPRIREKLAAKAPSRMEDYELVSGIAGIAAYFLEGKNHEMLELILSLLVERMQPIFVEGHEVPGFYVPQAYQFIERDKKAFPKGNFNLGMAHGVSGVIALFSLALLEGVEVERQADTLLTLSNWLVKQEKTSDQGSFWPSHVSFEEEVLGEHKEAEVTFDAWCYGTAGVSRALYLSSLALKNNSLKDVATRGMRSIAGRKEAKWNLNTPSICHGFAGSLLMTHFMAKETGFEWLKGPVDEMKAILLSHFEEEAPFGFRDFAPKDLFSNQPYEKIDKVGLLDGATGIYLVLLTAMGAIDSGWALPFLLGR